jgi:hypothetical protein
MNEIGVSTWNTEELSLVTFFCGKRKQQPYLHEIKTKGHLFTCPLKNYNDLKRNKNS